MTEEFIEDAKNLRSEILGVESDVFDFKTNIIHGDSKLLDVSDKGEVIANLTLAYRHLEDARMRIGKAIQAYDGGTSVYNR